MVCCVQFSSLHPLSTPHCSNFNKNNKTGFKYLWSLAFPLITLWNSQPAWILPLHLLVWSLMQKVWGFKNSVECFFFYHPRDIFWLLMKVCRAINTELGYTVKLCIQNLCFLFWTKQIWKTDLNKTESCSQRSWKFSRSDGISIFLNLSLCQKFPTTRTYWSKKIQRHLLGACIIIFKLEQF